MLVSSTMRQFLLLLLILLMVFGVAVHGRPNPVPNDEINEKEALEKYEREDGHKHDQRIPKVRRHEDDEDLEVIRELKQWFGGIRRRNLDYHTRRPDIFEFYVANHVFSNTYDSE